MKNAYIIFALFAAIGVFGAMKSNSKTTNVTPAVVSTEITSTAYTAVPNPDPRRQEPLLVKKIERLNVDAKDLVFLVDEVNFSSMTAVIQQLNDRQKTSKEIFLLIDSPGGSVFDGNQIVTAMEASKVPVHTVCIGLCASMAAIIHQHGVKRLMFDRAVLMFHPAAGGLQGTLEQMQSRLSMITRIVEKEDLYIAKRAGITFDDFKTKWLVELWIDGEDSVNQKFADGLVFIDFLKKGTTQVVTEEDKKKRSRLQEFNIDLR
jgi:ATP-dependent Clp protease protease subunit